MPAYRHVAACFGYHAFYRNNESPRLFHGRCAFAAGLIKFADNFAVVAIMMARRHILRAVTVSIKMKMLYIITMVDAYEGITLMPVAQASAKRRLLE